MKNDMGSNRADSQDSVTLKVERNQVVALREQLREMGHRYCHSCYVCYDDWAFARRRCFDRQLAELNIKLLVAVSDLVATSPEASND